MFSGKELVAGRREGSQRLGKPIADFLAIYPALCTGLHNNSIASLQNQKKSHYGTIDLSRPFFKLYLYKYSNGAKCIVLYCIVFTGPYISELLTEKLYSYLYILQMYSKLSSI